MGLIDVPNLKEIDPWENYFVWFKISSKEEEKCKQIGQILKVYILDTTYLISFKLGT